MNRRGFLRAAVGGTAAFRWLNQVAAAPSRPPTDSFLLSAAGCGRATGYAEASKIVTVGHRTHVAWLDAEPAGFRVRIRTLDHETGAWSAVTTIGGAQDNHGGPALTVDSRGYLHVVYYPHHQAFRYRRSRRPNDASEWEGEISFGEELSYPVLLCAPDDTLIMTARRKFTRVAGAPGRPWELELWKKPPDGPWRRERTVLRSRHPDYAHFQESLAWGPDHRTIHLACRIYETTGGKDEVPLQTAGYLVSRDAGTTWAHADGTPVTLPVTAETIDVLIRGGGASGRTLYSGSVAVDERGMPHRLVSVRENGVAHTWLAVPAADGPGWTKRDLHAFLPARYRGWDLVMPGAMTFSASGRATIVGTLANLGGPNESDWAHASNEVVRLWSDDGCASFQTEVLNRPPTQSPRWLPNIERPTGHHPIPDTPGIIFTAGSGGAGLNELDLNNGVWWRPGGAGGP